MLVNWLHSLCELELNSCGFAIFTVISILVDWTRHLVTCNRIWEWLSHIREKLLCSVWLFLFFNFITWLDTLLLHSIFLTASQCHIFTLFVWAVEIFVIIVVLWMHLIQNMRLFIKHLRMWLIWMHVPIECNMIFYFAFRIRNMIRLFHWRQLSSLPIIVLVANHVLFRWVNSMMFMLLISSWFLMKMMSMICLQREIMPRIFVLILPLFMISFTFFFTSWWAIWHRNAIYIFTLAIISTNIFFLIIHSNTWTSLILSIAIPSNFSLSWRSCICHRNIGGARKSLSNWCSVWLLWVRVARFNRLCS